MTLIGLNSISNCAFLSKKYWDLLRQQTELFLDFVCSPGDDYLDFFMPKRDHKQK